MRRNPFVERRSFLRQVGAASAVGALAAVTGSCGAEADYVEDTEAAVEESGDEPQSHIRPDTGVTDADTGPDADPAGQGRGAN